jgi:membrane-associated protease RseP (regulator of RpoE activity)
VFWKKSVVVLAGVFSHFVMATILLVTVFLVWGEVVTDEAGNPLPTLTLAVVAPTTPSGDVSPAAIAGFQAGDVVQTYDGVPLASWDDFIDSVHVDGGESVVIGYVRNGAQVEALTTLAYREWAVIVDDEVVTDEAGNVVYEEVGYFGAASDLERVRPGLLGVVGAAYRGIGEAIVQSALGLWTMIIEFPQLLASVFGGSEQVLDEVRPISPIGLARLAGPLETTLMVLALVNVFVGVLNFIPLYPLDGGHFAVALYEKIRGRVPDVRKLMPVAAVVVVFLITVGLMGVYLDIFKPLQL